MYRLKRKHNSNEKRDARTWCLRTAILPQQKRWWHSRHGVWAEQRQDIIKRGQEASHRWLSKEESNSCQPNSHTHLYKNIFSVLLLGPGIAPGHSRGLVRMSWIECSVILTSGAKQSGFTQITSRKEARAGIFVPILHVKRQKLEEAQQCGLEVTEARPEARTHVLWCVDSRMSPKLWWTMNHVQFFLTKNKSQYPLSYPGLTETGSLSESPDIWYFKIHR